MIGLDEIRDIAMALPNVKDGPLVPAARRIASFKINGKGFVGVGVGGKSMTFRLPEEDVSDLVAENPKAYGEIWRDGKRLVGPRVDLSRVSAHQYVNL